MIAQSQQSRELPAACGFAPYRPALHRLAVLTTCATFPLIFIGGLVTSKGVGMAVPDWPNSYGYNMFLYPPTQWAGGIFYEHTHRLWASAVGFLSIALALAAFGPARHAGFRRGSGRVALGAAALAAALAVLLLALGRPLQSPPWHGVVGLAGLAAVAGVASLCRAREPRRGVRRLTLAVLAAVCVQGLLGGLRVVKINVDWAVVHGCFAQAFFCLCAFTAAATSRRWLAGRVGPADPWTGASPDASAARPGRGLAALACATVAVIYLQLVAGAVMRHHQAGLAIPDFPTSYGRVLPPTSPVALDKAFRHLLTHPLTGERYFPPRVTLAQVWVHFAHRVGAALVTLTVLALVLTILWRHRAGPLVRPALLLLALLGAQLTLGILTVLLRKPADVATAHVAVGALTLVTAFLLAARVVRALGHWGRPLPQRQWSSPDAAAFPAAPAVA